MSGDGSFNSFEEYKEMQDKWQDLDKQFAVLKSTQDRLAQDQKTMEMSILGFAQKLDNMAEKIISSMRAIVDEKIGTHEKTCSGPKSKPTGNGNGNGNGNTNELLKGDLVLPEWFIRIIVGLASGTIALLVAYFKGV